MTVLTLATSIMEATNKAVKKWGNNLDISNKQDKMRQEFSDATSGVVGWRDWGMGKLGARAQTFTRTHSHLSYRSSLFLADHLWWGAAEGTLGWPWNSNAHRSGYHSPRYHFRIEGLLQQGGLGLEVVRVAWTSLGGRWFLAHLSWLMRAGAADPTNPQIIDQIADTLYVGLQR